VEIVRQDYEAAASRLEKAIALFERCDEDYLASALRVILGTVLQARGEGERAGRAFEEGLATARRLGIPSLTYIALYSSAQTALARGDYRKATRMLREGIEWFGRTNDRANLAYFLEALAVVVAFEGEGERSGLLLGAAEAFLEEVGARVYNYYIPDRSLYERAAATVRSQLGEEGFEQARAEGKVLDFEHAVEYALQTRP
jgi:tetratricopeptide (TPR) repeat protein